MRSLIQVPDAADAAPWLIKQFAGLVLLCLALLCLLVCFLVGSVILILSSFVGWLTAGLFDWLDRWACFFACLFPRRGVSGTQNTNAAAEKSRPCRSRTTHPFRSLESEVSELVDAGHCSLDIFVLSKQRLDLNPK